MDYIRCIAQAVHRRSAAPRHEYIRKMGLSYKALSCTDFAWVPRVRLLPVAQKKREVGGRSESPGPSCSQRLRSWGRAGGGSARATVAPQSWGEGRIK